MNGDEWVWSIGGMIGRAKLKYLERNLPSVSLFLCSEILMFNFLSCGENIMNIKYEVFAVTECNEVFLGD
jgi:hypothetical protein